MDKKLTLSLDQEVIERAKAYARKNSTSLSKMIESYFQSLTESEQETKFEITPLVESLSGVIHLPEDFDYKDSRAKYLTEKHR